MRWFKNFFNVILIISFLMGVTFVIIGKHHKETPVVRSIDIFQLEQLNLHLINYLKENIIKEPSGKRPELKHPEKEDFSQFQQGEVLDKLFENKKNGTFLEVGAFDGETFSNSLILEIKHGWTGLLVEPLSSAFKTLLRKNRRVKAAQCCLSLEPKPTKVTFKLTGMLGHIVEGNETRMVDDVKKTNEINRKKRDDKRNKRNKYMKNRKIKSKGAKEIKPGYETINCYPLYSLLVAADLTTLDLLSLDLEGSEVKVLKTIPWEKVNIKTIIIEVNHIPEGKDFLEKYLTDLGYELVQKLRIDYLFVKR